MVILGIIYFFKIIYIYYYLCTYESIHIVCACVCTCGGQRSPGILFYYSLEPDWWSASPRSPSVPPPTVLGLQVCNDTWLFIAFYMSFSGFELRSSCLSNKYFYPASWYYLFCKSICSFLSAGLICLNLVQHLLIRNREARELNVGHVGLRTLNMFAQSSFLSFCCCYYYYIF